MAKQRLDDISSLARVMGNRVDNVYTAQSTTATIAKMIVDELREQCTEIDRLKEALRDYQRRERLISVPSGERG